MDGYIQMAARTDPGRVRDHNEDCVCILPDCGLAILADGLGGHAAGEVASHTAVSVIRDILMERHPAPEADMQRLLCRAIACANTKILRLAAACPEYTGMGTTVVAALFTDTRMTVAHIGDSRAYRLRHGELVQLTRDHSLVQAYIEAGIISPGEARRSPRRHIVTRALGLDDRAMPDVATHATQPEDTYLLCSDGLSDVVTDDRIRLMLNECAENPERGADGLIRLANDAGGPDNISVVLIRIA